MAEDNPINDSLLDQEIESEQIPGGDDMDIDLAIENALDDLDGEMSLDSLEAGPATSMMNDNELGSLENLLESDNGPADLEDLDDIADLNLSGDDNLSLDDADIPIINDIFDPNRKKAAPAQTATVASAPAAIKDKDLLKQILALMEEVVDEAVKTEVEKISASLKHQVNKQLKARLGDLLKGK